MRFARTHPRRCNSCGHVLFYVISEEHYFCHMCRTTLKVIKEQTQYSNPRIFSIHDLIGTGLGAAPIEDIELVLVERPRDEST